MGDDSVSDSYDFKKGSRVGCFPFGLLFSGQQLPLQKKARMHDMRNEEPTIAKLLKTIICVLLHAA
jgi:hypothetical protein